MSPSTSSVSPPARPCRPVADLPVEPPELVGARPVPEPPVDEPPVEVPVLEAAVDARRPPLVVPVVARRPVVDPEAEKPGGMRRAGRCQAGPKRAGDYPSTTAFVERLFGATGAFAYLRNFRNDLRFAVSDLPVQSSAPIHEVLREGDLHITSVAVEHGNAPALAFRVEHAGHAVVFSGDLASKNDNLTRLASGADLLVYDTAVLDPPSDPPVLYDLHTAPHRIGEVAAAAGVRSLVLSHLTPDVEHAPDEVLASVRSAFKGEVRFAADCLRVDLTK